MFAAAGGLSLAEPDCRQAARGPYTLSRLPSALDPAYVRQLLEEETLRDFAGETPLQVIQARTAAGAAIRYPSLYHIDPRLAMLSAFCRYWLGDPAGAFWDLYEAVYGDPDNRLLRRARGTRVVAGSKRHIAVKDLTWLLEHDGENRDVYLLCRAFFYRQDEKTARAAADLEELERLGIPGLDDPRICWEGFPRGFLSRIEKRRKWRPCGKKRGCAFPR